MADRSAFTPAAAMTVKRMVLEKKRDYRFPNNNGNDGQNNVSPVVHPIQITNTTPTAGLYPATIQKYNPVANTWSSLAVCWFVDNDGQTPVLNKRYNGRLVGAKANVLIFEGDADPAAVSHGVRVNTQGPNNVLTATSTNLQWSFSDYDTDGYSNLGVDAVNLTIPAGLGGNYLFNYSVQKTTFPGTPVITAVPRMNIQINGVAQQIFAGCGQISGAAQYWFVGSWIGNINAGTTVFLKLFNDAAATIAGTTGYMALQKL